ncbi:mandelate racemase/muconate lactonizing enzyme family protein [Bosea sp. (in: a-proteobacteria)]|uniref:mandelate racemase/muconate lactonizing enzyme family protein n=1 Tax=Bosea sp. (in: a-proteobacteria) TaxID=1871050 RepID=UPI0026296A0C|nr:mandelate racemase/muconate lactonizing enzyme family protein [Bosea sp. (in: a-proteobacteria)]MCO5091670.1 mandelate racemase/muconate lactonizing enzyme family protein [Bosea sp. (in: a-proteobacteria)]
MRITGFEVFLLGLPADEPLGLEPANPNGKRPNVLLLLQTDAGVEGVGFTFLGAGLSRALKVAVEDMATLCIGFDPAQHDAIIARIVAAAGGSGPAGIFTLALAAIDIALWDIRAKVAGQPLWQLLGADGSRVPTYASGALMRELDLDAIQRSCGRLVAAGHRQVKMQLALPGEHRPDVEIDRIRRIREALGPDVALMCDINQRWSVQRAIEMGEALAEFDLTWIEDPAPADDFPGQARANAALPMPVAAGEYIYGLSGFRLLLDLAPPDFVMIDPFRAGGITPWLKIARLAEALGKPVVSHLAPEIQLHLIAAIPNGYTVEYMPWSYAMFKDVPWPKAGYLELGEAPGLGLEPDRAAIARFQLS